MTYKEIQAFESKLKEKGYKKIKSAKAELTDDYEWYKAFYGSGNEDYPIKYQIFFCFWNFTQHRDDDPNFAWSVSIVIIPESCCDQVGRRDLHLSVDWSTNIDKVEKCAEEFYEFITKIDNS